MKVMLKTTAAALLLSAITVLPGQAITITDTMDSPTVGKVTPGIPSGEKQEQSYIKELVRLENSSTESTNTIGSNFFETFGNFSDTLPNPDDLSYFKADTDATTLTSSAQDEFGTTASFLDSSSPFDIYVYGKYGSGDSNGENISVLWFLKDLNDNSITLPSRVRYTVKDSSGNDVLVTSGALSHTSFVYDSTSVPDGGATVALFGLSLLGLGAARRKMARRS